jgi:hypothetical protein
LKVLVLHIGMGRSGSELVRRISDNHAGDDLDVAGIEPLEKHGFYGWLVRSFIPGFQAPVREVDLKGYDLVYLIVPKWGYNCPPVNGFLKQHDLRGLRLSLLVTYSKGDVSGYSERLVGAAMKRGANVVGSLALRRGETSSGLVDGFIRQVSQRVRNVSGDSHEHEIVFIGMININRDGYLQGVVDVWRCRGCKKLFCDDRRYGEGLGSGVGFKEIPDDEQWALLICTDTKGVFMQSIPVKPGKRLEHTCKNGEKHEFVVEHGWSINPCDTITIHRLYMVKDYLNRGIEAGYYRLNLRRIQEV